MNSFPAVLTVFILKGKGSKECGLHAPCSPPLFPFTSLYLFIIFKGDYEK